MTTRFHPVLLGLFVFGIVAAPAAAADLPNIIIIFADDQGYQDLGCFGSPNIKTPHIDRMAGEGMRFTNFYSGYCVCSASRASLMTGCYQPRLSMPGVLGPRSRVGLHPDEVTIAEVLKTRGYATAIIGKWHLGYTPETMPNGQGFEYSFGHMGGCIDNYSHFFYWNGPNRHDLWRNGTEIWEDGRFFPDMMAEECSQFLEAHTEQPFFLYWAINVPHVR